MTLEEITIYMVKPEAMDSASCIQKRVSDAGLVVARTSRRSLKMRDIEALYGTLTTGILQASAHFLIGPPVEIALVSGVAAIERLLNMAGLFTDPSLCKKGTLRFDYGLHGATVWHSTPYYMNGIHRATSEVESRQQITHFFGGWA